MKKRFLLIILSATLLVFSFPNFNFSFLAWIALVPFFFAIDGQRPLKAFALSYLCGAIFFLGTIYWLIHVTLPGMIIVVLYLAIYIGIFGLIVAHCLNKRSFWMLLFIPAAWVSLELARSYLLTGFGWVLLAHSQSSVLPVIQIADITGAYGVSFLIVLVNTALFFTFKEIKKKNNYFLYLVLAVLILYLVLAYGTYRLRNIFTGEKLRVAVVQGNIPQKHKWDADYRDSIIATYIRLTRQAAGENVDLIIWPEASVPGLLENEPDLFEVVKKLAIQVNVPILVGSPRQDRRAADVYYNTALLFDEDGRVVDRYDKIHLVPFGEYLPFRGALSFVENFAPSPIGDFSAGIDHTVFRFFINRIADETKLKWKLVKKVGFSCLICFEDILPDLSREFVKDGAQFLVNITNDGWFGCTSAPYQHAANSVFRAVENRTNVVRAANTGLSCFIDQTGRITDRVKDKDGDIFIEGYKVGEIVLTRTRTIYTKFGDVFASICFIVTLCYIAASRRKIWQY